MDVGVDSGVKKEIVGALVLDLALDVPALASPELPYSV